MALLADERGIAAVAVGGLILDPQGQGIGAYHDPIGHIDGERGVAAVVAADLNAIDVDDALRVNCAEVQMRGLAFCDPGLRDNHFSLIPDLAAVGGVLHAAEGGFPRERDVDLRGVVGLGAVLEPLLGDADFLRVIGEVPPAVQALPVLAVPVGTRMLRTVGLAGSRCDGEAGGAEHQLRTGGQLDHEGTGLQARRELGDDLGVSRGGDRQELLRIQRGAARADDLGLGDLAEVLALEGQRAADVALAAVKLRLGGVDLGDHRDVAVFGQIEGVGGNDTLGERLVILPAQGDVGAAGGLKPLELEVVGFALLQGDGLGALLLIPLVDPPVDDELAVDVEAHAVIAVEIEGVIAVLRGNDAAGPAGAGPVLRAGAGEQGGLHVGGGDVGVDPGGLIFREVEAGLVDEIEVADQAVLTEFGELDGVVHSFFLHGPGNRGKISLGEDLAVDADVVHAAIQTGVRPDGVAADAELRAGLIHQRCQRVELLAGRVVARADLGAVDIHGGRAILGHGQDHTAPLTIIERGALRGSDPVLLRGVAADRGRRRQTDRTIFILIARQRGDEVVLAVGTGGDQTHPGRDAGGLHIHDDGDVVKAGERISRDRHALGGRTGDGVDEIQRVAADLHVARDGCAVDERAVVAVAGLVGHVGAFHAVEVIVGHERKLLDLGDLRGLQLLLRQGVVIDRNIVDHRVDAGVGLPEVGAADGDVRAGAENLRDGSPLIAGGSNLAINIDRGVRAVLHKGQLDPLAVFGIAGEALAGDADTRGHAERIGLQLGVDRVPVKAVHQNDYIFVLVDIADTVADVDPAALLVGRVDVSVHHDGHALGGFQSLIDSLRETDAVRLVADVGQALVVQLIGQTVSLCLDEAGLLVAIRAADSLGVVAVAAVVGERAVVEGVVRNGQTLLRRLIAALVGPQRLELCFGQCAVVDLDVVECSVHRAVRPAGGRAERHVHFALGCAAGEQLGHVALEVAFAGELAVNVDLRRAAFHQERQLDPLADAGRGTGAIVDSDGLAAGDAVLIGQKLGVEFARGVGERQQGDQEVVVALVLADAGVDVQPGRVAAGVNAVNLRVHHNGERVGLGHLVHHGLADAQAVAVVTPFPCVVEFENLAAALFSRVGQALADRSRSKVAAAAVVKVFLVERVPCDGACRCVLSADCQQPGQAAKQHREDEQHG